MQLILCFLVSSKSSLNNHFSLPATQRNAIDCHVYHRFQMLFWRLRVRSKKQATPTLRTTSQTHIGRRKPHRKRKRHHSFSIDKFGADWKDWKNMSALHANDQNIPVPFTSKLAQALQLGQTINMHGRVNDGGKRIELNLLKGGPVIGDTAQALMHANLRMDEGQFVMNSYLDGKWGKEERIPNPVKAGEPFDLRIRCFENFFEICINGEKLYEFVHRSPFEETEYLQVKGDCTMDGVHWGGKFFDIPWVTGFANSQPLPPGSRIHLYVIPRGNRWNVDWIARNQDVLFHLNPRMPEQKLIRNAHKDGFWMKEEKDIEGEFPFKMDVGADLTLVNEAEAILILVNGAEVCQFKHRANNPLTDYIGMRIDGEVEMTGIDFAYGVAEQ